MVVTTVRHGYDEVGPTAEAPASPRIGQMYFDTTLGTPMWWHADDGSWVTSVNATGIDVATGEVSVWHGFDEALVTADLPASPYLGQMVYDITEGEPRWWDGSSWEDSTVAAAVVDTGERTVLHGHEQQGTTAQRPGSPDIGNMFYDVTIKQPCWWDGTNWVDAEGTTV
jgi:hypothetical protein